MLTAEKMYSINFTVTRKTFLFKFALQRSKQLFVNGTEIYKFKAKDSEIVATPLHLGNISKDWSVDIMKITGFNDYVYNSSADYDSVTVDNTYVSKRHQSQRDV